MAAWTEEWNAFFEETDPARRRVLFESVAEDAAKKLEEEILQKRYVEKRGFTTDRFFAAMMEFMGIFGSGGSQKRSLRTARQYMEELGFLGAPAGEDAALYEELLYRETKNACARYLTTCRDASYGRKLFGLVAATDEEKEALTAKDIFAAGEGFVRLLGDLPEEKLGRALGIYCRGMRDGFAQSAPDAGERYERAKAGKKR